MYLFSKQISFTSLHYSNLGKHKFLYRKNCGFSHRHSKCNLCNAKTKFIFFCWSEKFVDFYERFLHCCKHFHKVFLIIFIHIKIYYFGANKSASKNQIFLVSNSKFNKILWFFVSYFKIYFMWTFLGGKITVFVMFMGKCLIFLPSLKFTCGSYDWLNACSILKGFIGY